VTGINDNGVLVGFDSSMNNASQVNDNQGWYKLHGQFFNANCPTASPAKPPVDQLLGVNDKDQAVGFFTDATAVNHGYEFDISSGRYKEITVSGFSNITTSGINNQGDIVGFYVDGAGNTDGLLANAQFSPTASPTNANAARADGKAKTKKVKTVLPKGC
jgi:hypothetical protein